MKRVIFKYSLIFGIVISISFCIFSQNQKNGSKVYIDNLFIPMENELDYPITNIFYRTPQLLTYYMENYMFAKLYFDKGIYVPSSETGKSYGFFKTTLTFRTPYASELFLEINDSITNYLLNHQLYDYTIKYFLDDEFLYGSNAYDIVKVNKDNVRNYTLICDSLNKEIIVDICQKELLGRWSFVKNKIYKVKLNDEITEFIKSNILRHNQLDLERDVLELMFDRFQSCLSLTIRNISKEEMKYYDNYFTGFDIVDNTVIVLRMLTGDAFEYLDKIEKDTLSIDQFTSNGYNRNKFLYNYQINNGEFELINTYGMSIIKQ